MTAHPTDAPVAPDNHQLTTTQPARIERPPWIALITGYLICSGTVSVAALLLRQFTEYNIVAMVAQFCREDHDWSQKEPWGLVYTWLGLIVVPAVTLAAGLLIHRRPARLRILALPVAIVMVLSAAYGTVWFLVLNHGTAPGLGWPSTFGMILHGLPAVVVPAFVASYASRASNRKKPEIDLIVGYLLVVGACGTLASTLPFLANGRRTFDWIVSPRFGWTVMHASLTVWRFAPIVLLLGGCLLLRRPARVLAVAIAVFAVTALHSSLQLVYFHIVIDNIDSIPGKIAIYLREPIYPLVMASFLLAFAIRHRHRFGPDYPACRKCGYNLTALTRPRCPECGTNFAPTPDN